jgi:hypothetical protein
VSTNGNGSSGADDRPAPALDEGSVVDDTGLDGNGATSSEGELERDQLIDLDELADHAEPTVGPTPSEAHPTPTEAH